MAPRLILADWLDDQGEEQIADLIRRTTTNPECDPSPTGLNKKWLPFNICNNGWLGINTLHRLNDITADILKSPWICNLFIHFAEDTFQNISDLLPVFAEMQLSQLTIQICSPGTEVQNTLRQLLKLNNLKTVTNLTFFSPNSEGCDAEFQVLADSSIFCQLNELSLQISQLRAETFHLLSNSEFLKTITKFSLAYRSPLDSYSIDILFRSPYIQNLSALSITNSNLNSNAMKSLGDSQSLKTVKELTLILNNIDGEGISSLFESKNLGNLKSLNLERNLLGSDGAKTIANSHLSQNLTKLNLSCNEIGDEGFHELAMSANLSELIFLDLSQNNPSTAGLMDLLNSSRLKKLNTLEVVYNPKIGQIADFASANQLDNLKHLKIYGMGYIEEDFISLFSSPIMKKLETLEFVGIPLDDQFFIRLLNEAPMPNLQRVNFGYTFISAEGVRFLEEHGIHHPNLRHIQIHPDALDADSLASLQEWSKNAGVRIGSELQKDRGRVTDRQHSRSSD